jgi:hypothetical protein
MPVHHAENDVCAVETTALQGMNLCTLLVGKPNWLEYQIVFNYRGAWWCSWLRHCTASQKVTGSIPDWGIGFFHCLNASGNTMVLGLIQPITEMSTRE